MDKKSDYQIVLTKIEQKLNLIKEEEKIPKVIYQTFPDEKKLPRIILENIRYIKELNLSWSYEIYDNGKIEEFIDAYYGMEVLKIYHMINPVYGAVRADLFRYLLIYAKGGVYLDIKGSMSIPLDKILSPDDRYILSKWDHHDWGRHPKLKKVGCREYLQWYIISVAGHPFLKNVILQVLNNILSYCIIRDGVGKPGVLNLTGPVVYTLEIEKVKDTCMYREVNIERDLGFIYTIFQKGYGHFDLFKIHYSSLQSPIISFSDSIKLKEIFLIYGYYSHYNIKRVIRKILRTISRKLTC